jgi:hypothetical protein
MFRQQPTGTMAAYAHVHEYSDNAEIAEGHQHTMRGVTGPAVPLPDGSHYHLMRGLTSYQELHYHCFCVKTSPAIPVANGLHVHMYRGETTLDHGHIHVFDRATLAAPSLGPMAGPAV